MSELELNGVSSLNEDVSVNVVKLESEMIENHDDEMPSEDLKFENSIYLNKVINELSPALYERLKGYPFTKKWFKVHSIYAVYGLSLTVILGTGFSYLINAQDLGFYYYACLAVIASFSLLTMFVLDNFVYDLMINKFLKKLDAVEIAEKEKIRKALGLNVFAEMDFSEDEFSNLFVGDGKAVAASRNGFGVLLKQFVKNYECYRKEKLRGALN